MARRKSPPPWIDPAVLYGRQEIADLTGLGDDVLSFWVRRKLLVPEGEAAGKGVHHRFHFSQVNVAIILKALRDHFGANISTLKSLADTFQPAIRLFRSAKGSLDAWSSAPQLADDLAKFRRGEPTEVSLIDDEGIDRRLATSEAEILANHTQLNEATPTELLRLAEKLGPGRHMDREIASALIRTVLEPRYSDAYWLLSRSNGEWKIRYDADDGTRDRSDVGPAMFLPVNAMIREVWSIPSPSTLRHLDRCMALQSAFKDARVNVLVSPSADHGFYPHIELLDESKETRVRAHEVYVNFFKPDWQKKRDKDDFGDLRHPRDYSGIYWTPQDNDWGNQ